MRPVNSSSPQWIYRQIVLQPPQPNAAVEPQVWIGLADTLLRDWLPAARATWRQRGWLDQLFYIRYGEGGYHLRLRLLSRAPEQLAPALADWLVEFYAAHAARLQLATPPTSAEDLVRWGLLRSAIYEPELIKYGGPVGMQLAEAHFAESCQIAEQVLLLEQRHGLRRSQLALELGRAMLQVYCLNEAEQTLLLKSHAEYWVSSASQPLRRQMLDALEQQFRRKQAPLLALVAAPTGPLERLPQVAPLFERWRAHLAAHFAALWHAERTGTLTSSVVSNILARSSIPEARRLLETPLSSFVIALNYMHLLFNRLSVNSPQEIQIAFWLYRALEERHGTLSPAVPLLLEPRPAFAAAG